MIDDMMMRKLSPRTQNQYIRSVKNLARYLGHSPHTATAEDLRKYLPRPRAALAQRTSWPSQSRPTQGHVGH